MRQIKFIARFLLIGGLLFTSAISHADEAIALLESIRASSDYREFKSRNEIPAPILAMAEKFAGAIYNNGEPREHWSPGDKIFIWAATGRNYYLIQITQSGGTVAYNQLLMYFTPPRSQEVIKIMELNYGGQGYAKDYSTLLEMAKTNPPRGISQSLLYHINQFLMNHR